MTEDSHDIPAKCLGETGALNLSPPTEQDIKNSKELDTALCNLDLFESQEEILHRREALVKLQEIANNWIREKALEQNLPVHIAQNTSGKIFTFGSYRLGVNFRGADVDSLFVVPRFISRDEFFYEFAKILEENENVEDIHSVVNAFVPVLKMKFFSIEIDLLFAKVDAMTIPDNFNLCENTESLMRNMDEKDVRSINGVRVTEDMLDLVYKKETFKNALKVIRIWAKRRNIYANALGFLGGVSWAILVCRICQLYPLASPSMIILIFFKIFSQWPWPKPVRLKETEYIHSLNLPVWDPRLNPNDQYHLMPILTPSYPAQNSTYNVTRSSRIIIERELANGLATFRDILLKKRPWSDLFEPSFFFMYKHYVIIFVGGKTEDKNSFIEICGLVESKLRVLVGALESNRYVKMAHVNCNSFGGTKNEEFDLVKKWLIGLEFDKNCSTTTTLIKDNSTDANGEKAKLNVDLSESIGTFEKAVERALPKEEQFNSVLVKYVKKSQLSQHLPSEDMDTIKKQAAAYAIQLAAQNKTREAEKLLLQQKQQKESQKSSEQLVEGTTMDQETEQASNEIAVVEDNQLTTEVEEPKSNSEIVQTSDGNETEQDPTLNIETNGSELQLEETNNSVGKKRVFPEGTPESSPKPATNGQFLDTCKIQSVDESMPPNVKRLSSV